jgi:hypothetical protein
MCYIALHDMDLLLLLNSHTLLPACPFLLLRCGLPAPP